MELFQSGATRPLLCHFPRKGWFVDEGSQLCSVKLFYLIWSIQTIKKINLFLDCSSFSDNQDYHLKYMNFQTRLLFMHNLYPSLSIDLIFLSPTWKINMNPE